MELVKIEKRRATVELTPEGCLALTAVCKGEDFDDLDELARLLVGAFGSSFEALAMAAASNSYLGFPEIDRFTLAHVREHLLPWRREEPARKPTAPAEEAPPAA